jgi:hypothetical protein
MGEDMPNIDSVRVVVYCCNQSDLIAANIEDGQFVDLICTREGPTKFGKRPEIREFEDPIP